MERNLFVRNRAIMVPKPQLRAEFLYLKNNRYYRRNYVRKKRRVRSAFGLAVPYQRLNVFNLHAQARVDRWTCFDGAWSRIEVPSGLLVVFPPKFSNIGSDLVSDRVSGWWVVVRDDLQDGCFHHSIIVRYVPLLGVVAG